MRCIVNHNIRYKFIKSQLDNRAVPCYTERGVILLTRAAVIELLAFYTESEKSKRVTVDGRNFYSLSYRYYGKVALECGEKELVSGANSVTFMPASTSYETEIIEDTKMAVVHFKLSESLHFDSPAILEVHDGEITGLFEKLIRSFRVDKPIDFNCMAIFYELLAKIEAITPLDAKERIPHKISLAREAMIQSFKDSCFSVSSLAEVLGVSTSYLRREFSKAYGKSPIAFLRDLRIENAKNLLQSEYLSIAQIAKQSGFSSESYFIQVFHKVLGKSPNRYREQFFAT